MINLNIVANMSHRNICNNNKMICLLLIWWVDLLCFFNLSGVNLKVQVHASGPDSVTVLPPRTGACTLTATHHLHSLCVCVYSI